MSRHINKKVVEGTVPLKLKAGVNGASEGIPRFLPEGIGCYGSPLAYLGTCEVICLRTNSRIRLATASAPVLARPLNKTREAPRSAAG